VFILFSVLFVVLQCNMFTKLLKRKLPYFC